MRTAYISFAAGLTDKSVQSLISTVIDQVNRRVEHIYLMMAVFGGWDVSSYHLYHFLRALPVKVTTHACGQMAFFGPTVALAGEERLAIPNATFLFSSDFGAPFGADQRSIAERLEFLALVNKKNAAILAERTKLTASEAEQLSAGGMKTEDAAWALKKGFVDRIAPLTIPAGATIVQPVL